MLKKARIVSMIVLAASVVVTAGLAVESLAYYLIFAMAAWLFALFVYYTVKLM